VPAIEAFAEMCKHKVSGVGVVSDGDGDELIAILSASDLRCIQPEHFGMLGLPVAEFLALLHGEDLHSSLVFKKKLQTSKTRVDMSAIIC